MIANLLTIAGSDPSGGAGIQADLKTFSALGTFGTSVITALTAQSTQGVSNVHPLPLAFIQQQLDTLLADVQIDSVKIGMIASTGLAKLIADTVQNHELTRLVVDPVMVAKGGDRLVDDAAVNGVRDHLLPLATIITPNIHEAGALLNAPSPTDVHGMESAAISLHALGPKYVLVTGGALQLPNSVDVLYDGEVLVTLESPRIQTRNTHGTGCTLSSAIAALLPSSADVPQAVTVAKHYVSAALAASDQLSVGSGIGPVHHFHGLWDDSFHESC